MVKDGAIGATGALAVDVGMGLAANVLPASMVSRTAADGSTNYLYYAGKAGLAVALGVFGRRFMGGSLAARMAAGSMTVMAYELGKNLIPAGVVPMGWFNPAPLAAYARGASLPAPGMNAYQSIRQPVANDAAGNGSRVASMLARRG